MSWGVSKRLKRILGVIDKPMESEVPEYLTGADYENTKPTFSSRDLANVEPKASVNTSTVEQRAKANMDAIQEKFFGNPKGRPVATTDRPKPLEDTKADRKAKVAAMNERYGRGD